MDDTAWTYGAPIVLTYGTIPVGAPALVLLLGPLHTDACPSGVDVFTHVGFLRCTAVI